MSGIFNIDKPQGLTSHDVVAQVRRICHTRRVGHAGTLDPLATGVLLVCVERATRLVEYLMGLPKSYQTTIRLGQTTNTYDTEGEITAERPFAHITRDDILNTLVQFRGPIQQVPPMYSALKVDGQPLYKLARQGKTVALKPRTVTIYALDLVEWTPPDLQLRVSCGSGTYIRSLGHDIGEQLGCGGHLTQLRRTAVGKFHASEAVPLAALTADNQPAHCLPSDLAVGHLPRLDVSDADAQALLYGQRIPRLLDHPQSDQVRVYNSAGEFLGLLVRHADSWQPKKMFPPQPANFG